MPDPAAPKKRIIDVEDGPLFDIDIDPELVNFIIVRGREYDVKVDPVEPDPGSNATDDKDAGVIEDYDDDLTETELQDAIDGLSDDAAHDLVAMYWIGRGDYTVDEWKAVRGQAIERGRTDTAAYLMGDPNFADFIEDGLSQLGYLQTSDEVEPSAGEDDKA